MRTEEQNVYPALIILELVLFIVCHLVSILQLDFETAMRGSVLSHDEVPEAIKDYLVPTNRISELRG
jgi:hypothetical protein